MPSWLEQYQDRRRRALVLCWPEWERAKKNQAFAAGLSQWEEEDKQTAKQFKFACLTIPEIAPIIDTASGRQILSRFERVYVPFSSAMADWAELLSQVDKAIMQDSDADQEESEAFRDGPCIQGLSCVRWHYKVENGRKRILPENIPIWQMLWPADEARRMNLVDRRWHSHGEWYPLEEADALWPDHIAAFRSHAGTGWQRGAAGADAGETLSSRVEWQGGPGHVEGGARALGGRQGMVFIEHYEYVSVEDVYRVYEPPPPQQPGPNGEPPPPPPPPEPGSEIARFDKPELDEFLKLYQADQGQPYPSELVVKNEAEEVYRYAKVVGEDVVLEHERIAFDAFEYEFITGTRHSEEEKTRWLAMVDRLKDPQRWVNLFLSSMVRMFQANPKGAMVVERGVFRNRSEAVQQWTAPSGVVEIERGRMSGPNRPFEFHTGQDSGAFRQAETLMGYAKEAMPRIVGYNPGALGQLGPDLRRISGEVLRGVQDAAVASNAAAYDAFALYRRRVGRLMLKLLKTYFEPEDIARIVGEKAMREDFDPATGMPVQVSVIPPKKYWDPTAWKAISISEAGPTPDQKRAQWQGLTESGGLQVLLQPHPVTGIPILDPEDVIEMMPALSEHRRDKIMARHRQRMQQAQQQAAQEQPQEPQPGEQPAAA